MGAQGWMWEEPGEWGNVTRPFHSDWAPAGPGHEAIRAWQLLQGHSVGEPRGVRGGAWHPGLWMGQGQTAAAGFTRPLLHASLLLL